MPNTFQILQNWDKGKTFSERMSGKILEIEGYEGIDPQSPMGGPDDTKDIICYKNSKKYVVGCYFPTTQKYFSEIEKKFNGDIEGVKKHKADGFVFVTNQKITPGERLKLSSNQTCEINIYHGERVCGILDSPKGYGVRLEYLDIKLSKEEQMSFLNSHLDLKESFQEIKATLDNLNKVTTRLAGEIHSRDKKNEPLSTLPISGVNFSSRLSIEDILTIQRVLLQQSQEDDIHEFLGLRKTEVWIGNPGGEKDSADFVPVSPSEISEKIYQLLKWWREKYMEVKHSTEDNKISAIASFHEKFLSIHPFLDGNGRVARAIASIQYKDLLNQEVRFEEVERSEYYKALNTARNGNQNKLNDIFTALIKE